MKTKANLIGNLSAKLIAGIFVLICLAAGAVGLVLPIIPGLLFLAIAVLIVARNFPTMERWLRRNRNMDRHLDTVDSFLGLTISRKIRLSGLLCLKGLIDSIVFIKSALTRLLRDS